jgi:chemotaxis signal transduction protein
LLIDGGTIDSSIDRQAFMAIYSPLRSRRLAAQQKEATQRLITFKLGEETFALPLDRVQKVTTLDRIYGDPQRIGMRFTTYQGQEVVLVDVEHQILGKPPQVLRSGDLNNSSNLDPHNADPIKYLVILQSGSVAAATSTAPKIAQEQRLVGITIDLPPGIQSMPLSAFLPLTDRYNHLHCVSAVSNVAPVNALLRRRAFQIDGASLIAKPLNPDSPQSEQPSIFLLDATSIVGG